MARAKSDDLHSVAAAARAAYVRERTRFATMRGGTPQTYRVPRSYDGTDPVTIEDMVVEPGRQSVWLKLADFFIRKRIDPVSYIAAQFERANLLARPPEPAQLMTPACVELWRQAKDSADAGVVGALAIEQSVYQREIGHQLHTVGVLFRDAAAVVLCDGDLRLSPLFRYCTALSVGGQRFINISQRYLASAVVQFERSREAYLAHWSALLPPGFADEARRLYPKCFDEEGGSRD